jgi:hypothetical protein
MKTTLETSEDETTLEMTEGKMTILGLILRLLDEVESELSLSKSDNYTRNECSLPVLEKLSVIIEEFSQGGSDEVLKGILNNSTTLASSVVDGQTTLVLSVVFIFTRFECSIHLHSFRV